MLVENGYHMVLFAWSYM